MCFDDSVSSAWEENYREAEYYFKKHGDLRIPADYIGSNGKKTSAWLLRQRKLYKEDRLNDEQIQRLNYIGMIWQIEDPWEVGFSHAKDYFSKKNWSYGSANWNICIVGFGQ